MNERCPTCGHRRSEGGRITPRELDILAAWWMAGSVKEAARLAQMTDTPTRKPSATANEAAERLRYILNNEDALWLLDAALRTERLRVVEGANDFLIAHPGTRMTANDHAEWWEFLRENGYDPLAGLTGEEPSE